MVTDLAELKIMNPDVSAKKVTQVMPMEDVLTSMNAQTILVIEQLNAKTSLAATNVTAKKIKSEILTKQDAKSRLNV